MGGREGGREGENEGGVHFDPRDQLASLMSFRGQLEAGKGKQGNAGEDEGR